MALRAMKWLSITVLLVLSCLAPFVSGAEIHEETDYFSEYSRAVQAAFNRCVDLPAHDGTWLSVC